MILKVFYEAIDPYYASQTQTFIGADEEDCLNQKYEFEKWLGREHPAGIKMIYRDKILNINEQIREINDKIDEYQKN